jgi:hypothetical protein
MDQSKQPLLPGPRASPDKEEREQERADARIALSHGAQGAAIIAGVAVACLLLGWLLFYFCLFLRRGYVG